MKQKIRLRFPRCWMPWFVRDYPFECYLGLSGIIVPLLVFLDYHHPHSFPAWEQESGWVVATSVTALTGGLTLLIGLLRYSDLRIMSASEMLLSVVSGVAVLVDLSITNGQLNPIGIGGMISISFIGFARSVFLMAVVRALEAYRSE